MIRFGSGGSSRRRFLLGGLLLGAALPAALTRLGRPAAAQTPSREQDERIVSPIPPAFVPLEPRPLSANEHVSWWSPVSRSTPVRARPDEEAPVIARLSRRTPEGTRNLVLVLDRRCDDRGALWVRARLPILGNDASGWISRAALGGYGAVSRICSPAPSRTGVYASGTTISSLSSG